MEIQKYWVSAAPYVPAVSLSMQPVVATILLLIGFVLTGLFTLTDKKSSSGFIKQTLIAIPASITLGFGFVWLLCAVGVYV
ncbi:hypothetical protein V1511DRAFT_151585 [Dipodascopsis uninucleata]